MSELPSPPYTNNSPPFFFPHWLSKTIPLDEVTMNFLGTFKLQREVEERRRKLELAMFELKQ